MKNRIYSILTISILMISIFIGLVNLESEVCGELSTVGGGSKTLYVGGNGSGNISLAFFFDPGCKCTRETIPRLEEIKNTYPDVDQF